MDEHFVIKASRQKAAQVLVDCADIELKAGPMVLRRNLQTVKQLCHSRTLVRLEVIRAAHVKQRIWLFPTRRHNAARTVIFERAPHHHLIIGEQGRGKRVAFDPLQFFSIEIKRELRAAVRKAARGFETCAHEKFLQDQPGRLALIASLISWGGSKVCAG